MTYEEFFQKAKLLEFRVIDFCNIDYVVMSVEEAKHLVTIEGDVVKLNLVETDKIKKTSIWLTRKDINRYIRLYAKDVYDED